MTTVEDRVSILETVTRFADAARARLFAVEGPDGDAAAVPGLLEEAGEIGLLADPWEPDPELDLGVWGRRAAVDGARLSLQSLAVLGEACAGLAAAVHGHGLACLALSTAGATGELPGDAVLGLALQPGYGLAGDPRSAAAAPVLREGPDGLRLVGRASGIVSVGPPDHLVVLAGTAEQDWAVLALPGSTAGVRVRPVAPRLGLRNAVLSDAGFDEVRVLPEHVVAVDAAARRTFELVQACDWLGETAIMLGVARRALLESQQYAAARYQGGAAIEAHAAVRLLLGYARCDVDAVGALLQAVDVDDPHLLSAAASARLAAAEHCSRAVTNALQVLGGYGYMDDYGQSKRLRDLAVLRRLHGTPDQLALLLGRPADPQRVR